MSWEDAINAAKNDSGYDLSKLTNEEAAKLFTSKIDPQKIDKVIEDLKQATSENEESAKKLANVLAIVNTVVSIGRVLVV